MRRFNLLALLTLSVLNSYGQANLILTSGKVIPYMKMEAQPGYLNVWESFSREKIEIAIDSVVGYYKFGEEADILRIKVPDNSGDTDIDYQFLPYGAPGKIKTYSYRVDYQKGPDGKPLEYFYIGKDDRLAMLFPYSFGSSKAKSMDTLKTYVADQPEIVQAITADSYTLENVRRLINQYNLLSFTPRASADDPQGVVTFYRMKKGELRGPLTMTIDDKAYTFTPYQTINVNVSTLNPVKLCVGEEGNMLCELIQGIPYFRTYFKVGLSKDRQPSIERINKTRAFEDIKILKQFQ